MNSDKLIIYVFSTLLIIFATAMAIIIYTQARGTGIAHFVVIGTTLFVTSIVSGFAYFKL